MPFHPNMEAFRAALGIMILATPYMFGVLTLFTLVILLLSKLQGKPAKDRND